MTNKNLHETAFIRLMTHFRSVEVGRAVVAAMCFLSAINSPTQTSPAESGAKISSIVSLEDPNVEIRSIVWPTQDTQATLNEDGSVAFLESRQIKREIPSLLKEGDADRLSVNAQDGLAAIAGTSTDVMDYRATTPSQRIHHRAAIALGFVEASSLIIVSKNDISIYADNGKARSPSVVYQMPDIFSAAVSSSGTIAILTQNRVLEVLRSVKGHGISPMCKIPNMEFSYMVAVSGSDVYVGQDEHNISRVVHVGADCRTEQIAKSEGRNTLEELSVVGDRIALTLRDIATPSDVSRLEIWSIHDSRLIVAEKLNNDDGPLALSPDGKSLMLVRGAAELQFWEITDPAVGAAGSHRTK